MAGAIDPSSVDFCVINSCPQPPTWCGEIIPDGLCDHINVIMDRDYAFEFVVLKEISDLDLKVDSSRGIGIGGKKVADSSVTIKSLKGDEHKAVVATYTKKFNANNIIFKGSGDGIVDVITGRFNNNSITFKKKSADLVMFNDDAIINTSTINAGGGTDTITFMENSVIRGINEITLGPGKDVLELPANKRGKGKIIVTVWLATTPSESAINPSVAGTSSKEKLIYLNMSS